MHWIKITSLAAAIGSLISIAILFIVEEKAAFQNFVGSWYFNIVVALISGSIGFFAKFIHIDHQIERQMIVNTTLELRDAFIDEMAILQSDRIKQGWEINRANVVVGKALAKHHKAVLRYGVLLPKKKRKRLESAWAIYSCKGYWDKLKKRDDDYMTEDPFVCYDPKDPHDPEEELELRKLALKRIKKMLKIV